MRILADIQIPLVREKFSTFAEVNVADGRLISNDSLKNIDILLVRSVTRVTAELLENTPVKFVGTATSGIDHIDTAYLTKNNIEFISAHGSNARSVVEYILSCLCVLEYIGQEISKKPVVGIVGYGKVGSLLHKVLGCLGVQCLINDPPLAETDTSINFCQLAELSDCDIISLHVPLTTESKYPTCNLIDAKFLDKTRSNVTLFNTSRGGVIAEDDLKNFLHKNSSAKVVLDVWQNEPFIDKELVKLATIATSHIAGYAHDAKIRATKMIYDALCQFLNRDNTWDGTDNLMRTTARQTSFDKNFNVDDMIMLSVLGHYDVRSDSVALRRLTDMKNEQMGIEFDHLRKTYPLRREFSATTIFLSPEQLLASEKLKCIGFQVGP